MAIFQTTQRKRKLSGNHILPTTSCPFCHYRNDPINKGFHSCCGIDLQGSELAHLQQHGIEIAYDGSKYHEGRCSLSEDLLEDSAIRSHCPSSICCSPTNVERHCLCLFASMFLRVLFIAALTNILSLCSKSSFMTFSVYEPQSTRVDRIFTPCSMILSKILSKVSSW